VEPWTLVPLVALVGEYEGLVGEYEGLVGEGSLYEALMGI
jgi:hypothetical protein